MRLKSTLERRYFGLSGPYLHGGVYSSEEPDQRFHVELIDHTGRAYVSTRADGPSDKKEIPDGYGFRIPVPFEWLSTQDGLVKFQFRVRETGQIFPASPRDIPVDRLLKLFRTIVDSNPAKSMDLEKLRLGLASANLKNALVVTTHAMTRTGAPMIILEVIRRLKEVHGCQIVLLALESGGSLDSDFRALCDVVIDNVGSSLKSARAKTAILLSELHGILKNPVVLANSLCCGEIVTVCKEVGFRIKSLIHEYPYAFDKAWIFQQLEATDGIVFPCQDVYDKYLAEQLIPPPKTGNEPRHFILPQGCYLAQKPRPSPEQLEAFTQSFRKKNHLRRGDRLIAACGSADPRKGFDWFANLIRHFSTRSPHASSTHFVWIGSIGVQDVFFHALHDLRREGVIGNFHHIEEMQDTRMILDLVDVFLLCSRIDPFPSVVLEAMHSGVPVVGFDRDQGTSPLIVETGFGAVVPYQDFEATTAAIGRLLEPDPERTRLQAAAVELVSTRYDFASYADHLADWALRDVPPPNAVEIPRSERREPPELHPASSAALPFDGTCTDPTSANHPSALLNQLKLALHQGLDFLADSQHPDGEFPQLIWNGDDPQTGIPESSPFITALLAYSLEFCGPRARPMLDRALSFLQSTMEPQGVWRFYSPKQFKHNRVPPDVDDTACASFVLKRHGKNLPDHAWVFEENRSSDGLYWTWMVPGQSSSAPYRAYLETLEVLAEMRSPAKPPEFLGNSRFFTPKDAVPEREVDAIVNANVLLYLGESTATQPVIDLLIDVVKKNRELESTFYYCDAASFYYMVGRAYDCAAPGLNVLAPIIRERIASRLKDSTNGSISPLNLAMSACALLTFAPDSEEIGIIVEQLLSNQREDGSWPRAPFYAGLAETWGSDELTTGFAVEAISRYLQRIGQVSGDGLACGVTTSDNKNSISLDMESEAFALDPYPTLAFLREHHPVVFNETSRTWLVTRHRDIIRVLDDPETYSSRDNSFESVLMGADGPDQERAHGLVRAMFAPNHLSVLEAKIRGWTASNIAIFRQRGACDFQSELAATLPIQVIIHLLGAPDSRLDDFARWGAVFKRLGTNRPGDQLNPDDEAEVQACRAFFRDHIAEELRRPSQSPFTSLAHPNHPDKILPEEALVDIAILIMSAGTITTINLLSTSLYRLALNPDIARRLRKSPEDIAKFIEEVLRYDTLFQDLRRGAVFESILAGQTIPIGARIQLMIGSGNRDARVYPNADSFLIDRKPNRHLAFGLGAHACVGMALSRLEAKIVIGMMLEAFETIELDWNNSPTPIWTEYGLRRPARLPLSFSHNKEA